MASELAREELYGFEYRERDKRRVESREDKNTYDIKQFWQRHHEIINYAAQGYKQTEIAYILGIHPQTVSNTLNSTLGEGKLSEVRKERDEDARLMVERVKVLKDKALKVYQEILDGENEQGYPVESSIKDKLHAADVVTLEFAGMKAPTKIQSTHVGLSGEDLLELKRRGLQEARECGFIIDVEVSKDSNES